MSQQKNVIINIACVCCSCMHFFVFVESVYVCERGLGKYSVCMFAGARARVCVCESEREIFSQGAVDILTSCCYLYSPSLTLIHALNGLATGFLTAVATATVSDTCYFLNNYSTRERRWVEGWRKEGKKGRGEDEKEGTAGHEPFAQNGWLKERYEWKEERWWEERKWKWPCACLDLLMCVCIMFNHIILHTLGTVAGAVFFFFLNIYFFFLNISMILAYV